MGLLQFIAERLSASCDRRPTPPLDSTAKLGRFGERVAAKSLKRQGYKILASNWKTHQLEVDFICRHEKRLVFVEVKTRRDFAFGLPAEAVQSSKQNKITRAAAFYLKELGNPNVEVRFDVVEVIAETGSMPICNIIPNAYAGVD